MNVLTSVVARWLYALPFGFFGIIHFTDAQNMAGFVPGFLPWPAFWVYIVGLGFIAAAISIIIEKKTRLACLLLGIVLIIFDLTIHIPGLVGGEMMPNMPNLLKDTALAGAAWYIAGTYSDEGGGEEPQREEREAEFGGESPSDTMGH